MEPSADLVLRAGPGAPWVLHAGAAMLLFLHVAGASLGLVAGGAAMIARKGRPIHRVAGTVFFGSMLAMAATAAVTALFLPGGWTNTTAAVFTLYLIATSWVTIRRRPGEVGRFEVVATAVPIGIAAMGAVLFVAHAGRADAPDFATVYAFAVIAALAAVCDAKTVRQGGLSGALRIARHLWRMSLALFIAAGSFFFGQADEIPAALQGPHLAIPPLAVLAALAFWMVRVRLGRWFTRAAVAPA